MNAYLCVGKGCMAYAEHEYFGYCPDCWRKLPPEDRALISGKSIDPPPRVVTYRIPVVGAWRVYLLAMLGGAVGTVLANVVIHYLGR